MNQYFGIDGGGSKTHLATADETGAVTGLFVGKGTNHQTSELAEKNLLDILSHIKDRHFNVGVFCIAGWDFDCDKKVIQKNIKNTLKYHNIKVDNILIENDVFAILKSGLGNRKAGVVLASGTGTIAACIDGEKFHRTYSCGFVSGEWGSGHDMAEYALHIICAAEKGIEAPVPVLRKYALAYFACKDVDELIANVVNKQYKVQFVARFLEQVIQANNAGCKGAQKVLEKGGRQHAKTIYSMLKKVQDKSVPIVLGGGVFNNGMVLPGFKETLEGLYGTISEIRLLQSKPVYGALLWALQQGKVNTELVIKNICYERLNEEEHNMRTI